MTLGTLLRSQLSGCQGEFVKSTVSKCGKTRRRSERHSRWAIRGAGTIVVKGPLVLLAERRQVHAWWLTPELFDLRFRTRRCPPWQPGERLCVWTRRVGLDPEGPGN